MTTPLLPIRRDPITQDVVATLRAAGITTGDGQIPPGANWVGQPALPGSNFKGYAVVNEITASHSSGPLSDSQADWQMPYLLEVYGISRTACSTLSDDARTAIAGMRTHTFEINGATYGLQQVRIDSIGEPTRVPAVQPPVWRSQNGVTLWIGKGA